MKDELIRKDVEGSGSGVILWHYPGIYLKGLRKPRSE
jgi:hypothetical protein